MKFYSGEFMHDIKSKITLEELPFTISCYDNEKNMILKKIDFFVSLLFISVGMIFGLLWGSFFHFLLKAII